MKKIFILSTSLLLLQQAAFGQIPLLQNTSLPAVKPMPNPAIIAHRGTTYWAPEETEAAYRWARNMGADYLEADLQLTKDGVLLTLHDDQLTRTTNIAQIYPLRQSQPANHFTYLELLKLDAGSWFNHKYPERARKSFSQLEILTLEDLVKIAQGYRIKRGIDHKRLINPDHSFAYVKDEADNGNRPGLYLEFKKPELNPGIEKQFAKEIKRLGWNIVSNQVPNRQQAPLNGKVKVGYNNGKLILQTFSRQSFIKLDHMFQGHIPTTLLVNAYPGQLKLHQPTLLLRNNAAFAKAYHAHFLGLNIMDPLDKLYQPKTAQKIRQDVANWVHKQGLGLHPYSFDTTKQLKEWQELADGVFTNRTDLARKVYATPKRGPILDAKKLLDDLGYY